MRNLVTAAIVASLAAAASVAPRSIAGESPTPSAAPEEIQLNNNGKYKDALDDLLKNPPAATATLQDQLLFIRRLTTAEMNMRDYSKAVSYARQLVKLAPNFWAAQDTLSVASAKPDNTMKR